MATSADPEITPAKFAVAVMVLRMKGGRWQAILVARKDDHTRWSLPGGKVDPPPEPMSPNAIFGHGGEGVPRAETTLEAAYRELHEETGVVPPHGESVGNLFRFIPQGTVLDSGGYLTTFYLLDTTGMELPETFEPGEGEAPVRWGFIEDLLTGPYANENRARFSEMGLL